MQKNDIKEKKVLIDEFGEPLVNTTNTVTSNASSVGFPAGVNSSSPAVNPNKNQVKLDAKVEEMRDTLLNKSPFSKFLNSGKIVADAIARGVKNNQGQMVSGHYVPSGILVPEIIATINDADDKEALKEERAYQRQSQKWEKSFRERDQNHNIDIANRSQDRADLQYLTNEEQRALNNDFRQRQFLTDEEQRALNNDFRQRQFEDSKSNADFDKGLKISQLQEQKDLQNRKLDLEREKLQLSKLEKEDQKGKNEEKQAQELKVAIEKGREVADIFNKMPDDYFGGGGINAISRSAGKFFGTENSQDAERVRSAGSRLMIESLKSTFGGNISDGEREALIGILSDFSVPKDRLYANLQNEVKSMLATRGIDTNLVNEILPPLRSDNEYNPEDWED